MLLKARRCVFYITLTAITLFVLSQILIVKYLLDRSLLGIVSNTLKRGLAAGWPVGADVEGRNVSHTDGPIVVWWDGMLYDQPRHQWRCGSKHTQQCLFTNDKTLYSHPRTRGFMFYGTGFRPYDLPLPRAPGHIWALLHEESMKNNPILLAPQCQDIFNLTATFDRKSDLPLTLQFLTSVDAIETRKYLKPTRRKSVDGRAPVVYIHSDCDPPSDRDSYALKLMEYIQVDSLGKCLHNKDLPEHLRGIPKMNAKEFLEILSRYKFVLAFENVFCDDYVTEKLWRSFEAGTVPVYRGSPSVRDWLPDPHSAILVSDFSSPQSLAEYLHYLDKNDKQYETYLDYKRTGVSNTRLLAAMEARPWILNDYLHPTAVPAFECLVCRKAHELELEIVTMKTVSNDSKSGHMTCSPPSHFYPETPNKVVSMWIQNFKQACYEARALVELMSTGDRFGYVEFRKKFYSLWRSRSEN